MRCIAALLRAPTVRPNVLLVQVNRARQLVTVPACSTSAGCPSERKETMMSEFAVCARCGAPVTIDNPGRIEYGIEVHQVCRHADAWIDLVVADAMSEIDVKLAFMLGSES